MRFARHARIFRGPLDPAPTASVLLLLLIFLLLGSMLYTPGVLVQLGHGQPISVMRNNDIYFDGSVYRAGDMDSLRAALRDWPGSLSVRAEPGSDPKVAQAISNLFEITVPDGKENLRGTDDETVAVAVNFRGQCFLENRLVGETELRRELAHRAEIAATHSQKLTMILRMDKAAEHEVFTRLCALADAAGVWRVELAERPAIFDGRPQ